MRARKPSRVRTIALLGVGRVLKVEICHACGAILFGLAVEQHQQWHRQLGEALRGEQRR